MHDILDYCFVASIAQLTTATAKTTSAILNTMSDISTLEKKVSDLIGSINNWNRLYLWALAFALLAGAFSFWAQRQAISKSRELVTASNDLSKEKDRQLQRDLKDKDLKIADANRLAAEANKATEDERTARVELEDKVAWRTLSDRQQEEIKADLDRFAGQLAECGFPSGDIEAFSFSSEIAAVLRASGWQVVPPNPNVITMKATSLPNSDSPIERIDFGVDIVSTSDDSATSAAQTLAKELEKLGFDAHFRESTQRPQASRVWITVQHRPLGPQGEAKLRAEKAKTQ